MKLNIGPGHTADHFFKLKDWEMLDCERGRTKSKDMVIELNKFVKIPRKNNFYDLVYASHVLEHINPTKTIKFLSEIRRVMKKDAVFRIVIPDAKKSMIKFLNGEDFPLFERRKSTYHSKNRGKSNYVPMTDFEAMRQCFISLSQQANLHKKYKDGALAHQNAWDFDSIKSDLMRAGFKKDKISLASYENKIIDFQFESILNTEAKQHERSLYIEAVK